MAVLGTGLVTTADIANNLISAGVKWAPVVEMIAQVNQAPQDAIWLPTTDGSQNYETIVRQSYGNYQYAAINEEIYASTTKETKVSSTAGCIVAYSEFSKDHKWTTAEAMRIRTQLDYGHTIGITEYFTQNMFYGRDTVNVNESKGVEGLSIKYNSLSGDIYNGGYIIDAGGEGTDNASIWVVNWDPQAFHCFYPGGEDGAGFLKVEDMGLDNRGLTGGFKYAYVTRFTWPHGFHLANYKTVIRICNIDRSLLNEDASGSSANLPRLLTKAFHRIDMLDASTTRVYMDRDIFYMLAEQLANGTTNSTLELSNVGGLLPSSLYTWKGIPIRRTDALNVNEAAVV